ncbi:hypothetical protein BH20CHL3_BH20CHL3_06060 [soil metagenome]
MADSGLKQRALMQVDVERAGWQALVAEVGAERMSELGPMGEWSFKDLTSHLTGWRGYSISRLEAALRGEGDAPFPWPPVLDTDDEINQWIYDTEKDRPLADVLTGFDATFARLRAVVEEMPEEMLIDPNAFPWMEGESLGSALVSGFYFDHWRGEHEPTVRAWLDGAPAR